MKALTKPSAAPGAALEDRDIPRPGAGELLLRVRATSICGTDLHIWRWDEWARATIRPPLVFGHELAGEVVETGAGVEGFAPGDRVSVESHVPCGRCRQCRADRRHICDRLEILGVHRPGAFAEYASVPAVCAWKNPAGMAAETASVMEPLGNGVHAAEQAEPEGKTAAVLGCGPAGLFAVAALRALGAERVIAVDPNPHRRALALRMGAESVAESIEERDLDVVLEMSGNPAAFEAGLRSLRKGGTLVAFGIPRKPLSLDLAADVILTGRRIVGVVGRHMFRTWELAQRLVDEGHIDPARVITHRFRLAEYEEAFRTLETPDAPCGKVVMVP